MVLYNEKIKHLSCSDLRVFLKRLVKDKIEKEWNEDFIAVSYTHLTLPTICSV